MRTVILSKILTKKKSFKTKPLIYKHLRTDYQYTDKKIIFKTIK